MNQRGSAHLVVLVVILLVLVVGAFLAYQAGYLNLPNQTPTPNQTTQTSQQEPTVSLKSEYQNPFDKDTQYVNPFNEYKNPFDSLDE